MEWMPFTLLSWLHEYSPKQNCHKGIRVFGEVTAGDFVKATWHMETAYGNLLTLKGKGKSGSE